MKKFITAIILALVASLMFTAKAQVSYSKPEGQKYEVLGASILRVFHYFANDSYELYVPAYHSEVDDPMRINLGKGKNQAVQSLTAIKQMMTDAEENGYINIGGKSWKVTILYDEKAALYMQSGNISGNWIHMDLLQKLIKDIS